MLNFYFHTSRLIVRPLTMQDAFPLYEYRSLEEVARYQSWDYYTLDDAKNTIIKNRFDPFNGFNNTGNVAVEKNGTLIGDLYVAVHPECSSWFTIGYTFDPKYHHLGYAREAVKGWIDYLFSHYPITQIHGYVVEGNVASMRLLIDLGFRLNDYDETYGDNCFILKR